MTTSAVSILASIACNRGWQYGAQAAAMAQALSALLGWLKIGLIRKF
jgi:hypothetical protein